MGLGVLEDKVLDHVPGKFHCLVYIFTERLVQSKSPFLNIWLGTSYILEDERDDNTALDSRLKYDRSGDVPILLVPQPSDDPNDPLVGRRSYGW